MELKVTVDWKTFAALGLAACSFVLAIKMDPAAAERVSIRAIDTFRVSDKAVSGYITTS